MPFSSLQDFIEILDKNNELFRIKSYVNTELQIAEITDRISKSENGGKAILFENTGFNFQVLTNILGSYKRMELAFDNRSLEEIQKQIFGMFYELITPKNTLLEKIKLIPVLKKVSNWIPTKKRARGVCQEVVINNPDLSKIPILKTWIHDGGKFITLPIIITTDPETGLCNAGMYRMQVIDKCTTAIHWHRHKTGANHFEKYKKLGKRMPVTVAIGGDPCYYYSATAPLPENVDEFILAGFLRNKKVEMVKCLTNDHYVPSDVDFVLEGYIDPNEYLFYEGPFGDHTGFYSLTDYYPKFHLTSITHRKNAIYTATLVGIPPQEDAYIMKATEKIFLSPIRMLVAPEVLDMNMPFEGVAHNIAIVKIEKSYPGQALKVAYALWGAGQMMFNKILIVCGKETDLNNTTQLLEAIMNKGELHFSKGVLDVLDHSSSKFSYGSKMLIDSTTKLQEESIDKNYNTLYFIKENKFCFATNDSFIKIGLAIVSIDKEMYSIQQLIDNIETNAKITIVVDKNVDLTDFSTMVWLVANNIDPIRDCYQSKNRTIIDGTIKIKNKDNFSREWPNVVCCDDKTIEEVDKMWASLNIGELIKSPSLRYKRLVLTDSDRI